MEPNYKHKEVSMGDENKPKATYFLKITPKEDEDIESLGFNLLNLKNKKFAFGEFNNYILSSNSIEPEYALVEFFPNSRDVNIFADKYKTCRHALDAAITHLNEKGLDATPFDLGKLVNNIKIKHHFKNDKGLFVDYS